MFPAGLHQRQNGENGQNGRSETSFPPRKRSRRGVAAVEAAMILPVVMLLMMGVWEVGRFVDMSMTLQDAARRGARIAAGGVSGGTPVTVAMVQTTVQNYLQAAGFPSAALQQRPGDGDQSEQQHLDRSLATRSRWTRSA